MPKIPFKISARTAKLIGQENFSNSDDAIIELIKNSYDADAKCAVLVFNRNDNSLQLFDDGEGMNELTIKEKWMRIGTDNKLNEIESTSGRLKTGAKGIGRFALDRLGTSTEMITINNPKKKGLKWEVNWNDFLDSNKNLNNITATLSNVKSKESLLSKIADLPDFIATEISSIQEADFNKGTWFNILNLKESWEQDDILRLYKRLSSLLPPKNIVNFQVYLFDVSNEGAYGEIGSSYFNDFDYEVKAYFNSEKLKVDFEIHRNEIDPTVINKSFKKLFRTKKSPFDLKSISKKRVKFSKDIYSITRTRRSDESEFNFKSVGSFGFHFYFSKLKKPTAKNSTIYPYIDKDYEENNLALENFGGIKIYRDYFRVRPYGENRKHDWLNLGSRASSSPASAGQREGDWRVRPTQVGGTVTISRTTNKNLKDKSDRSGLIENIEFDTFKTIILSMLNQFEWDRSRMMHPFYLENKRKEEKEKEKKKKEQAKKIAEQISIKNATSSEDIEAIVTENLEDDSTQNELIQEKDLELRWLRSLASLGLIVVSLDHELSAIRNNLEPRIRYLTKHLKKLISEKQLVNLRENENPFTLIRHIQGDHKKLKGWLDYSLTAIKVDKRKRKNLNFGNYFETFKKNWKFVLKERNVTLELTGNKSRNNVIRAFEVDIDSIFNNLLTNSLEAFKLRREKYKRTIKINWKATKESILINYSDNGIGVPNIFDNKNEIFNPFVTTKKDKRGNEVGTGLGLYIVSKVLEDYEAEKELLNPDVGFSLLLKFKKRKNA